MRSTIRISDGPRVASSLNPSCSCSAVNSDGASVDTAAATSGGANVSSKSQAPANPVRSITTRCVCPVRKPLELGHRIAAGAPRASLRLQTAQKAAIGGTRRPGRPGLAGLARERGAVGGTATETRSERAVLPRTNEREHRTLPCLSMRLKGKTFREHGSPQLQPDLRGPDRHRAHVGFGLDRDVDAHVADPARCPLDLERLQPVGKGNEIAEPHVADEKRAPGQPAREGLT